MTFIPFLQALIFLAAVSVSFDEIQKHAWENEYVQIRGFVYRTASGDWILSPDPHLKSCCIGALAKQREQVYLEGSFESLPKARAILMKGFLQKEAGDAKVRLIDASLVDEKNTLPWMTVLVGIVILSGSLLWIFKTRV